MKVLFIGGTGVISQAVSRLAVEAGIDLYLVNRGQRNDFIPREAKLIQADIKNIDDFRSKLTGMEFDSVVNWIVFEPGQLQNDVELFKDRTNQYVFISSASAYQKPPTHYIITESTPLANPYWQYSRDKIACEEILNREYRENSFPATIVRPSLTYGLTMIPLIMNSWQHPWTLIDRMRRGKKVIVPGDGTSLWTITHNTDFAKGFLGLLGNPASTGHAFHITSDEVLTWDQMVNATGKAAGIRPEIIHISSDFICSVAPELQGSLIGDKAVSAIFDNSKIKRFVPGYTATTRFDEGIRQSVDWFEAHPEKQVVDEEWDQMIDRIIESYEVRKS